MVLCNIAWFLYCRVPNYWYYKSDFWFFDFFGVTLVLGWRKSGIVAGSILVTKLTLMQTKWWVVIPILRLYWCGSETYDALCAIKNIQQANRAGWPAEERSNRAKQTKEKQGQEEHFWKQGLLTKSHWSKSLKIHVKRLRWKHLPGKSNAPLLLYWVRSTVQSHETNIKGVQTKGFEPWKGVRWKAEDSF